MSKKAKVTEDDVIEKLLEKRDSERRGFDVSLQRTANEIKHYRRAKKLLGIAAMGLLILITAIFVVALMYSRYSSFTVKVDRFTNSKYQNAAIQISDSVNFDSPTTRLECPAVADITNIDGSALDMTQIGSVDGADNGDNYLCYTFYLKNVGNMGVNVDYTMTISNVEKNLDEACRIRVIYSRDEAEREITDYAKANSVDEITHVTVPEEGTTPFVSNSVVCQNEILALMPGEICKFTVVIWIEGPDEQCTDDKIGGLFETDMLFEVSGVVDATDKET